MFGMPDLSNISLTLMIPMVMAAGAFFLAFQAVMSLFSTAQTQRIVNQRLQFKDRFETTSEAMVELRKSRGLDEFGNFTMPIQWFNQLVVRSGLPYRPARWFAMSGAAALVVGFVYLKMAGGVLTASGLALAIFALGPILARGRHSRQNRAHGQIGGRFKVKILGGQRLPARRRCQKQRVHDREQE